ncbi:uncharacterized protein LOC144704227 [Wolffia australiana]
MKGERMRGFMCQPSASTAVCIPVDTHSVVVPRRPDRTLVDHATVSDLPYSKLARTPPLPPLAPPSRPDKLPPSKAEKLLKLILPVADANEKKLEILALPPPPEKEKIADLPPPPRPAEDRVIQVVVLRVSLHCQGCAGKVKKHISKMEGVTSFSVDLEAKRVTVKGHVSPERVLESVSKVKKAELWPSQAPQKASA